MDSWSSQSYLVLSAKSTNHRIDHNNHSNNHLSWKLGNFQNGGIFYFRHCPLWKCFSSIYVFFSEIVIIMINYVCRHATDWQLGLTCMITNWIGIHPVLSPLVIAQVIIEILSSDQSRILSHFSIMTNAIIAVVLYFSTTFIMLL